MGYELMGRAHAWAHWLAANGRRQHGQGTVEYVALILLVAVILAGVVAAATHNKSLGADIPKTIVSKLKGAIDGVGKK
jgi:hypothetical protein